jgi:putative oxidoreductase
MHIANDRTSAPLWTHASDQTPFPLSAEPSGQTPSPLRREPSGQTPSPLRREPGDQTPSPPWGEGGGEGHALASAAGSGVRESLRAAWNRAAALAERLITHDTLAIAARLSMAATFFYSGRTKVSGLLSVTPGAVELFRTEYKLPWVPPDIAAHAAAYSEHFFPLLLVLGLGTRLSAAALLGMTLVIEVFVYPDAWPTHLSWAALFLYLIARGGGRFTLDRLLRIA